MNVGGRLMLRHGDVVREVETPGYTMFSHLSITNKDSIYCIGQGPRKSSSILKIDVAYKKDPSSITVIRESRNSTEIDAMDISEPANINFESNGVKVSAWFYKPKNRSYIENVSTLPPVLVLGHYGPTAYASNVFDIKKQFFTSRGFAVLDINYRGSTGFGSSFRHMFVNFLIFQCMLKNQWGIVDRDDIINGTKAIIERGLVDKDRVCIMGSSAGGYLVLASLIHSDIFKAAVSIYGVADLVGLAKDTHKFEKGYNEILIGKYPEDEHIYKERSPINHIHKIKTPIAFLHGKEDTVVPVQQSIDMYERLKMEGVTTALMTFESESLFQHLEWDIFQMF
uniref:Peptidase_S9 domain-containing protein n=1 Tax=Heterorhabditis bacteriophora TaxID=37862 RepID=A0A1I7X588_HETBA